ncbi:MAG: hypothetical protein L0220_09195 [Acidobacteria bacterium]|nr:hypothetical protein [Acidobacteriota bacterium]
MKSLSKPLTCLFLVSIFSAAVVADTIKLKDGSVLKGKVVSYNQRKFTIVVYIGGTSSRHIVSVDEIESVEFDSTESLASARNTAEPSTGAESSSRLEPVNSSPSGKPRNEPVASPVSADPPPVESDTASGASGASGSVAAEKNVNVPAAADWTSTEIRLQRGQKVVISASGEVDLGENKRTGPDGLSVTDNRKLVPNRPTGSLIAVVGDDNDDFIHVGSSGEFVSPHNGILFLSVNEGNLKDNNGSFQARVRVLR